MIRAKKAYSPRTRIARNANIPRISEFYGDGANLKVARNRFDVGFFIGRESLDKQMFYALPLPSK